MTREEAIESFKKSNEVASKRLEVEKLRMDVEEIKELEFYIERDEMAIKALERVQISEWDHDHDILKAHSDGAREALDKVRAEISEYGSIWVQYVITDKTKTDKGIEKLVEDVTKQTKTRVLEIIDKYREVE